MSEWQWIVNNGLAVAVVVFVGLVLWRVLVGSEKTGYQGILIRWAQGITDRMGVHFTEQMEHGKVQDAQHAITLSALHLLVESQNPPVGAAFLSAKAVHKTAHEVEQMRKALHEFMKACRLIASQFPDVEQAVIGHCDAIEQIVGEQRKD